MANSYLNYYHLSELKAAFPNLRRWVSGSFWMQRRPVAQLRASKVKDDDAARKER